MDRASIDWDTIEASVRKTNAVLNVTEANAVSIGNSLRQCETVDIVKKNP